MFESVVANLLNKYLKDYVDNFDPTTLNIGVWSGDINLSNLSLKSSAFDAFNLPISVFKGHIGHFVLKIPWTSLGSSSVVATIEDLYLVTVPKKLCEVFYYFKRKVE
jgi:vacuolar protein sorting-associated protein 13A/C